ncbi:MAG: Asp-tRNA(Asn)/Glu-tRNA(Gln) amidotransferase subunit GatA [Candidatus Rokubacteria bacterium]|nr:Asp-tRNA(Asn)/Glu-tRNA(Gln) amidotransferase subunit GatA [Candidatus Rokubacteria bacterium]
MTDGTLTDLAAAVRARQLSPVEIVTAYLARIERLDRSLRAFITLDAEGALAAARALEADAVAGRWRGPLHGVPLGVKDLCAVPGLPCSGGSRTPDYFRSPHPCTAVQRLTAAGAITLGTLNMTEFALGPFGDNVHHGDVQNPWRPGHVSGGSSSGSGAAVAAGLVAGALGSDTGGSIRLPAASCGIVGLKPTYGRVSRAGVMPLSWTMDHLGPMARTVRDVAVMLGVIAGHDPLDATSSHHAVPEYPATLARPVTGVRAAVPTNHFGEDVEPEVAAAVATALTVLEQRGARVSPARIPDPKMVTACNNPIVRAECATVHARVLRERPHELGPVVRSRAEAGFAVSAVEYLAALEQRAKVTREFITAVFADADVLVTPTIPEPAPSYETAKAGSVADVIARMSAFTRFTRVFNTVGLPALSLPCGFTAAGLPVALQIVGRPFDEATVLRVGHAYEQATEWHRRRPPLD